MPYGIPVATVALNGAMNAGILAAKILAVSNPEIAEKLEDYQKFLSKKVLASVDELKTDYPNSYDE